MPRDYIIAVKKEIAKYPDLVCKTVYFGGGTPSLARPEQICDILNSLNILPGAEITLEANPDTLTLEKLQGYRRASVNRLSIGVQTAYDKSLENLGRIHSARGAKKAFDMAKAAGFTNISGDLMIGLDDYSEKELTDTIDFLRRQGATHISAYMLKIEKGTPFYVNPPKHLAGEEQMRDYYLKACDYLAQKGYEQYEISNFAKDGMYSRHNSIYWQLGDYLGIGPAAHSCIDGKRFYYERNLKKFLTDPTPIYEGEVDKDDYIMLSLRLKQGLDLKVLKETWGILLPSIAYKKLERLEKEGYIKISGSRISLTPKGFLVENGIAGEIMMYE